MSWNAGSRAKVLMPETRTSLCEVALTWEFAD
jgi:hypothetical protein